MLTGTAAVDALAADAPTITAFADEALHFPKAQLLHLIHEVWAPAREAALPPALHPVNPPTITWSVMRAPESVFGPFTMAQTRIVCRSGVRGRGFGVSCFVDNADAANALASRWGVRTAVADVRLSRHYDEITTTVVGDGGRVLLDIGLLEPQPISPEDVQYTDTMVLAQTPLGLRLVQVEQTFAFERAERGRPVVTAFDGGGWGQELLRPSFPVSVSSAVADVTFEPVRFVCKPDELAFTGTERVTS